MKITVISRWFNEAMIAPFFLSHYAFANEIIILLDEATTDATAEVISRYPNAKIRRYRLPGKVNYSLTTGLVSQAASAITSAWGCATAAPGDWLICPDADEFVFPAEGGDARETLSRVDGNLVYADMWQVYRHRTDSDLDPSRPAVPQRRHGDPNRSEGWNSIYKKPIVVKPGLGIKWTPGFHRYYLNPRIKVAHTRFNGAHWIMADIGLALARRMRGRRELQSEENLRHGMGVQNFDITEEKIRADCEAHENDPQLF